MLRTLLRGLGAALIATLIATPAFCGEWKPGGRVLLDAHNCYPYDGEWADRIDRALATGVPVSIEQDIGWYVDPQTGKAWSILTHHPPYTGNEPTMREYFFERVRPIVETALASGDATDWPLIVVTLDLRDEVPEHLAAFWTLLGDYEDWLCTAERGPDEEQVQLLDIKPILMLTGNSDIQAKAFHDDVPVGERLRVFGAVHNNAEGVDAAPRDIAGLRTNYRRWWNNPWRNVEDGGQWHAGSWTADDDARLRALVEHAHLNNLWIRFYTLDGFAPWSNKGWSWGYNFGTQKRAAVRWRAAIQAGVDFIATDQYEAFDSVRDDLAAGAQ